MPVPSQENYSVLLIDDEVANVEVLAAILESENYAVFRATSGEKGIEILDKERIDLVLLDVLMPGLDGFETLSRIRVHKKTKDLPVIFLTGIMRDPRYMERGFGLGVNEYLLKPIDASELLVRVRSILRMNAAEKKVNNYFGCREGNGAGSAICKNIVEAHGGKIWIESKENAGSSFYFSLPLT